jgi:hypothetical protein
LDVNQASDQEQDCHHEEEPNKPDSALEQAGCPRSQ